jgi:hypothetical protein
MQRLMEAINFFKLLTRYVILRPLENPSCRKNPLIQRALIHPTPLPKRTGGIIVRFAARSLSIKNASIFVQIRIAIFS